jgi:hypothetical protein
MASPSRFIHLSIVTSVTDSPTEGTFTSTVITTLSDQE